MYKRVCVFACEYVYVCAAVFRAIGIRYLEWSCRLLGATPHGCFDVNFGLPVWQQALLTT